MGAPQVNGVNGTRQRASASTTSVPTTNDFDIRHQILENANLVLPDLNLKIITHNERATISNLGKNRILVSVVCKGTQSIIWTAKPDEKYESESVATNEIRMSALENLLKVTEIATSGYLEAWKKWGE